MESTSNTGKITRRECKATVTSLLMKEASVMPESMQQQIQSLSDNPSGQIPISDNPSGQEQVAKSSQPSLLMQIDVPSFSKFFNGSLFMFLECSRTQLRA